MRGEAHGISVSRDDALCDDDEPEGGRGPGGGMAAMANADAAMDEESSAPKDLDQAIDDLKI